MLGTPVWEVRLCSDSYRLSCEDSHLSCGVRHHQMQPQEAAHLWLFGVEILHTVDRLNGTEICGY